MWTSHSNGNSESQLALPVTSRTGLDRKPCPPLSMLTGHVKMASWLLGMVQRLELFMEATGGAKGPAELSGQNQKCLRSALCYAGWMTRCQSQACRTVCQLIQVPGQQNHQARKA